MLADNEAGLWDLLIKETEKNRFVCRILIAAGSK